MQKEQKIDAECKNLALMSRTGICTLSQAVNKILDLHEAKWFHASECMSAWSLCVGGGSFSDFDAWYQNEFDLDDKLIS